MKTYFILLKKDLLELWRNKRFLIIAVVFIVFALGSPIMARMMPEIITSIDFGSSSESVKIELPPATITDSYDQFVSNITQMGVFAIIATFGGLIVRERRKGLYNNLVNNGVNKIQFLFAKVDAQCIAVTVIYLVSCLLFSAYNYILFDAFLVEHSLLSFLSLYVYLIFIICLVNFFATIAKSTTLSIVLSFAVAILIGLFEFFKFGKYLPNHLVNISFDVFRDPEYLDYAYTTIGIGLLISLILAGLSVQLLKNKE